MLTNEEKRGFIKTIFDRVKEYGSNEEAEKEILSLIMKDTCNGKMYKYRKVGEYSLQNLKEGTLYCAKPSSFNDPFDCKVGIDFVSIWDAMLYVKTKGLDDLFSKFILLHNGTISMKECDMRERDVFENWESSDSICKFVEKINVEDISDNNLSIMTVNNLHIIYELVIGFLPDNNFKTRFIQIYSKLNLSVRQMSEEQKKYLLGEIDFYELAKSFGIKEDVDQITAIKIAAEISNINNSKLADIYEQFDNELKEMNEKLTEDIDNMYRVGSLCTDNKNSLMWSHYADGHKGFCVEYDFNVYSNELENCAILPVIYEKERVKFPWIVAFSGEIEDEELKTKAVYTKILSLLSKDEIWKYENEWRVISSRCMSTQENIKMPPISCIYVGALCNIEDRMKLYKIAKEKNIPIKQMVIDRGEYKLHAKEFETM